MIVASILAACGAQAPEGSDANGPTTAAPSRPSEIFFPRVRRGLNGGPDALLGGKLVLDKEGCLRLDPGDGASWVPVWPAGLELETGEGRRAS